MIFFSLCEGGAKSLAKKIGTINVCRTVRHFLIFLTHTCVPLELLGEPITTMMTAVYTFRTFVPVVIRGCCTCFTVFFYE